MPIISRLSSVTNRFTVPMWISRAERPLQADELCHALAAEIGSPDIDTDDVPSIQTLL